MKEKQGIKKRKIGIQFPMVFGTIFEEVAVSCFEKTFDTKVKCKNISIVDPKGYNYMIFSPDGLCALPIKDKELYINYEDEDYKEIKNFVPTLIEIKCPTKRDLVKDGNVPKHYYPQIQAGLLSIDVAYAGIFIDNQIRVCSYQQLYDDNSINNKEKYSIHYNCRSIEDNKAPINIGAILVYGDLPKTINKQYIRREEIASKKVYDLGNTTYRTFTEILSLCRDNLLRMEYLSPCDSVDELSIVDKVRSSNEEHIGIICWKLFDVSYTVVNKNLEFIQKIAEELEKYHIGDYDLPEMPEETIIIEKKETIIPKAPDLSFDSD